MLHLHPFVSNVVRKAGAGEFQNSWRLNPNQARHWKLYERMIPILSDLMFDGVSRLSCIVMAWGLITALVERWWPETHTFHLPV